ncbi:MAG TPA: hypothetical protein VEF72_15715 [Mycobacterium sp.]|nr:hypothetical protein [Mycobacterium sp.]
MIIVLIIVVVGEQVLRKSQTRSSRTADRAVAALLPAALPAGAFSKYVLNPTMTQLANLAHDNIESA